jgi:streptogramin lyase
LGANSRRSLEKKKCCYPAKRLLPTLAIAVSVGSLTGNSFQSNASIAGVVVRDIRVAFKEWRVPTPGSHPHDPLATRDGAIWYTGQLANLLGRVDPKTGQFREYRLKTANSGPHGVVSDASGNIWFTASFKGYVGKLDPVTGDIREFPLPDPKARDPHTPVFDQKGTLWFSPSSAEI